MGKKVMVVDDSKFMYEEIKFFLNKSEFEVVGYSKDGEGAVACYDQCMPDVVTMDIVLPGIDGFEASAEILKVHPDAKIIVVSSLAYDDTMTRATEIGAKGFLFKPIEKALLLEALSKVFEEENA
ncbi:MAG: response regulator [Oscillospiraceae bacterium]|mgnify:FL=1|nr:response regulator [Oscillospiraceae bacterium]MCI9363295.1 response regulator [Oscillospiraceae bacterium]MCI9668802.1 response regulator [Oscillospiraceae bacterium]RKJ57009.1 response regulator [bacterium 1XD42-8]RKJ65113.1 response regulator [bacterium 1XD42-1]